MNAQTTLGETCDIISGVSYKPTDLHPELNESSIPLLRANNITNGELSYKNVQFVDSSCVTKSQILQTDDILVCASSGSKSSIGKAAQFNGVVPTTFGAFCKAVRPRLIQADYLFFFFQSDRYRNTIESACTGTNINNLNSKIIKNISLDIPAPEIQIERAMVLRAVSMQIRRCSATLRNFDNLIKSRFIEMFGDPNQIRVAEHIEDAFDIRDDLRKPLSSKERASMHSGAQYPYYGANGIVDYIDRFLTDCPAVCLAEDCGSYGAGESSAYIITGKAWVNNHAHLLIPTVNHALQYAQTFFQLLDINRFISGTTRSKLTQAQLKKIPFALPGQLEREQFENFVAQIDKLRFDVQRQIEKLETLKKSLMQEYFG